MTKNTFPDAMVDIETLGTRVQNDHVILSAGIVAFDLEQQDTLEGINKDTARCAEWRLDINEQADRHIDGNTVVWWLGQEDAARKAITEGKPTPLAHFFDEFTEFIHHHRISRLWGNGPTFDNNALRHLLDSHARAFPLKFYCDRDLRTLTDLYERVTGHRGRPQLIDSDTDGKVTAHNALVDAMIQTVQAQHMWRRIRGG